MKKKHCWAIKFSKTDDELLSCTEEVKEKVDYLYIVIDDNSKYRNLSKLPPEFCGIFCDSNAFGLGVITQILRKANSIPK